MSEYETIQKMSKLLAMVGVFNIIFSKKRARCLTVFISLLNSAFIFPQYM